MSRLWACQGFGHVKALALGGTDEGVLGVRANVFYLAYFRDLDGNKIALFAPNK